MADSAVFTGAGLTQRPSLYITSVRRRGGRCSLARNVDMNPKPPRDPIRRIGYSHLPGRPLLMTPRQWDTAAA